MASAFVVSCNDRPTSAPPAPALALLADGDARVQRAVKCERDAEQVAKFMLGKKPPERLSDEAIELTLRGQSLLCLKTGYREGAEVYCNKVRRGALWTTISPSVLATVRKAMYQGCGGMFLWDWDDKKGG